MCKIKCHGIRPDRFVKTGSLLRSLISFLVSQLQTYWGCQLQMSCGKQDLPPPLCFGAGSTHVQAIGYLRNRLNVSL